MAAAGFEIVDVDGGFAAVEWGRPSFAEIASFQMSARRRVDAAITALGLTKTGPELTFSRPPDGGSLAMAPGVLVDRTFESLGAVSSQTIPSGRAVHFRLVGSYAQLPQAWADLNAWLEAQRLERLGLGWEIYGDPSGPVTDLFNMVR